MDKIIINPIELTYQKPTDIRDCYIELFPDHLYFRLEFWADEPIIDNDPASGWESILSSYEWVAMKRNVAGIEKCFTHDKKWGVFVIVAGFTNDLKTYYKRQSDAQIVFSKLQEWLTK